MGTILWQIILWNTVLWETLVWDILLWDILLWVTLLWEPFYEKPSCGTLTLSTGKPTSYGYSSSSSIPHLVT